MWVFAQFSSKITTVFSAICFTSDPLVKAGLSDRDLIRQARARARVRVDSREELQTELRRASDGVIFITIQKFAPGIGETCDPSLASTPRLRG